MEFGEAVTHSHEPERGSTFAAAIESMAIAVLGAAVMIGSVLPWAYYRWQEVSPGQSADELHPAAANLFDGEITLVLGGLAIAIALVAKYRPSIRVRLATLVLFLGAASIALGTMDLLSPTPSRSLPEDFLVAPGYGFGLIITLVAALGGTLVSLVWLIRFVAGLAKPRIRTS